MITEATLKAFPKPESHTIRTIEFPDFDSGFHAVAQLYAEGVRPTMIDYGLEMWPEQGTDEDNAILYISLDGFAEDVETQLRKAIEVCGRFQGKEGDQQEAQDFWKGRHSSGENYKQVMRHANSPFCRTTNRRRLRRTWAEWLIRF